MYLSQIIAFARSKYYLTHYSSRHKSTMLLILAYFVSTQRNKTTEINDFANAS